MIAEKLCLSGKTALVTGSSQGIGKGIALAFAEYGADVILHYRKDENEVQQAASELKKFNVKVYPVQADLSEPGSVSKLSEAVFAQVDKVDILVINASVQLPAVWTEVTEQEFDTQVDVNLKSTFLLMQKFAPKMIDNGWGRIVTIGSVQQIKPHPNMIVYAATKSAVLNMVQNVAMQLADKNVTVNNLAPGVIDTPRIGEEVGDSEERINKRLETPAGKIGSPEDCAGVAVLLCSEAGNFITGQNIFVDGGMSL
ncbi:SDR family NAD(P)-dependent oxidoreductase [Dyadobacter psychrotolerans]|uniref:SDR family oxidoreductase n=1 Tax=Dyadobacter psychrotolerans TaxID=2541721 RepID=A0A4R5DE72_9BACT|nr:SDR family oxidoreductase [Dyadobacter psychrotolerans]TDE10260.1 SDR family oxidoreductase [Dyadobacter psychrotolerans]